MMPVPFHKKRRRAEDCHQNGHAATTAFDPECHGRLVRDRWVKRDANRNNKVKEGDHALCLP